MHQNVIIFKFLRVFEVDGKLAGLSSSMEVLGSPRKLLGGCSEVLGRSSEVLGSFLPPLEGPA